jgi:hypothetical protein
MGSYFGREVLEKELIDMEVIENEPVDFYEGMVIPRVPNFGIIARPLKWNNTVESLMRPFHIYHLDLRCIDLQTVLIPRDEINISIDYHVLSIR